MSHLKEHPVPLQPDFRFHQLRLSEILLLQAQLENDMHGEAHDDFRGIDPQVLWHLNYRLLTDCRDVWEAFSMLAEQSPTGKCWYDVLIGPQHAHAHTALGKVVRDFEKRPVAAVDLGAGTGNTSLAIAPKCKSIIGIDPVLPLLEVAAGKFKHKKKGFFTGIEGDALEAAQIIEPESADVVVCNAVIGYFEPEEVAAMYDQIHQILVPGGRFYEYQRLGGNGARDIYTKSYRAQLAGETVRSVFQFSHLVRSAGQRTIAIPYDPSERGFSEFRVQTDRPLREEYVRLFVKN
jgi:SAM-dependent methyltransferase